MSVLTKLHHSSSVEETIALGEEFAASLKAGDSVGLFGELGSGKTHFVKGIARGLGVGGYVKSPSFTIINEHDGARLADGAEVSLFHIDLYRINDDRELPGLGLEDYICSTGVSIIEWADKAGPFKGSLNYNVFLSVEDGDKRLIEINKIEP